MRARGGDAGSPEPGAGPGPRARAVHDERSKRRHLRELRHIRRLRRAAAPDSDDALGGVPPSSSMMRAKTCRGSASAMQLTAATLGRSARASARLDPPPKRAPVAPTSRNLLSLETVKDFPVPGRPHTYTLALRPDLRLR